MKRNNLYFLFIIISIFIITGCDDEYKMIYCTRNVKDENSNIVADMRYDLYYDENEIVKKTVSIETITTKDEKILTEYEKSYKKAFSKYKNIKYYDNNITINDKTLTSKTTIDYSKVNVSLIKKIEGSVGNIFTKTGKVKLATLVRKYEKNGSKCYGHE